MRYRRNVYRYRPKRRRIRKLRFTVFIIVVAAAVAAVYFGVRFFGNQGNAAQADASPSPTQSFLQEEASSQPVQLEAHAVSGTMPSDFNMEYDIMENGEITSSYIRPQGILFPSLGLDTSDEAYTVLKGITTFRGNNYRSSAGWGTANVAEKKLEALWNVTSGTLSRWSGSGYTGQPLIVQWDDPMRQIMNLYPEKAAKQNLTEVIYPTMDGKIYFLDLDDGTPTRDPIDMGFTVKGTASIDPRGYPLLYVGQGIGNAGGDSWDNSSIHIYSLIDGSELYSYGFPDKDPFSLRDNWQAWDSSPLIASDADTLVWPGENGILYTFDLYSSFDDLAGTVTVSPDEPVKYRYTIPMDGEDGTESDTQCYGIESSAAAYLNYVFFTDNCGFLQCLDLNTMTPVWVQDVTDDSDATMVVEEDGENVYLYTGCEIDKSAQAGNQTGLAYARKIDALTGEVVWEVPYECFVVSGADSGILASPVLGQGSLDGLVFFTIASTGGSEDTGLMVAFNKETGEEVWQTVMDRYAWSSPVAVYADDGTGYLIQCDSGGYIYLVDGKTGEILSSVSLDATIEAAPAVFNDIAVVGTRGEKIYGVKIK